MPTFAEIPDVEVFSVGKHKGREYTEKHLDEMVDNFRKFSSGVKPLVDVPSVIGHEESQPLMDNTGIPKIGRVETLEKSTVPCEWCGATGLMRAGESDIKCPGCGGTKQRIVLQSILSEVHPKIADLIRNKNYDKVSLEVYDKPPEGIPGAGKMARRLALLGGQLPQIKTLASLPTTFAESTPRQVMTRFSKVVKRGHDLFEVFSELVPVVKMGGPGSGPHPGSNVVLDAYSKSLENRAKEIPTENKRNYETKIAGYKVGIKRAEEMLKTATGKEKANLEKNIPLMRADLAKYESEKHSEKGTPMNRNAMLAKLDQMGIDISAFTPENITDEALKALIDSMGPAPAPVANAENPVNALLNPSTGDDMAKKMAERRGRFAEYCKKMAEGDKGVTPIPLNKKPDTQLTEEGGDVSGKNKEGQLAALGMGTENRSKYNSANHAEFSERIDKRLNEIESKLLAKLAPASDKVDRFMEEVDRDTVTKFCENMLTARKVSAAEMDTTNPRCRSIIDRLMSLDNKAPVVKFKESHTGKEVAITARQEAMEEIKNRQAKSNGQQIKAGGKGVQTFAESPDDVAQVESHWENFSEDFERVDTSKKEYVEAFKNEKKNNRKLTAEEYNARTALTV